jgi:hypothetical protein
VEESKSPLKLESVAPAAEEPAVKESPMGASSGSISRLANRPPPARPSSPRQQAPAPTSPRRPTATKAPLPESEPAVEPESSDAVNEKRAALRAKFAERVASGKKLTE